MKGAQRLIAVGALAIAVLLATVLGGDARARGTASASAQAALSKTVQLTAEATTRRAVPGGAANAILTLSNSGKTAVRGASLTFTASAGLHFAGLTDLARLRGFAGAPGRWTCKTSGSQTMCADAATFDPTSTRGVLVRFDVAAGAHAGRAVVHAAAHVGSAPVGSERIRFDVASGQPSPALFAQIGGTLSVNFGQTAVETVDVLNAGSGPATGIQLGNLLPATVVGTWQATGDGWSCSGGQGSPPSCRTSASVAVGALAPRLTVRWSVDPARVSALNLHFGGAPSDQTWSLAIAGKGATPIQVPLRISVMPPAGSLLVPGAVAAHGLQELLPGARTTVRVKIANVGGAATLGGVHVAGEIPVGTAIVGARGGGDWACTTDRTPAGRELHFACEAPASLTIGARQATHLNLALEADKGASPGTGQLALTASAGNEIAGVRPRVATLSLIILEGNKGFPALTLLRALGNGKLAPAVDGAAEALRTNDTFTERLDIRNAGGAAITAGTHATLTQALGRGVSVKSVSAPAGWRCSSGATLTCSLTFGADLAPAATLQGPTVVLAPTAATRERSLTASIRLDGPGAPPAHRVPVLVSVEVAAAKLVPNITITDVPTAGGTGAFGIDVKNEGNASTTEAVHVGIHLPKGAHFDKLAPAGWLCTPAPNRKTAMCASRAPLAAGASLPRIDLTATFAVATENRSLVFSAHASDGAKRSGRTSSASTPVVPRHALRALIKVPEKVAFRDQPLVRQGEPLSPTVITLGGDGSGGSGLGLTYRWEQRCLTAADASTHGSHCDSVTPRVHWLNQGGSSNPNTADVSFEAPQVTKPTILVFDLTVTDGSATSSASTRVKILPFPTSSGGFAIRNAHPAKEKPLGPATERRKLPLPAESLKRRPAKPKRTVRLTSAAAAPAAETTTAAATTTAPATTTTPTTTGTTTTPTTTGTTTTGTTTTTGPALPAVFCSLVREALNSSGSFSASVGGVSLTLDGVRVTGTACAAATVVHFSGASFGLHGYLHAHGLNGSISQNGITIGSGTITGPDAWHAPTFTVGGGGLSIPFNGSPSLSGTVTGQGFGFVPLPSGWSGSTSVSFSAGGSGGTSVSVDATATGPRKEASPNSPAPAASISGSVADDGTFSLTFSISQMIQLEGAAVDVSGHVKRTEAGGPVSVALEGSLAAPVKIVSGLSIETLKVRMEPTADSLGITGSGTVRFAVPSGSVDVNVGLKYADPADWSLTVAGGGTASWTPVPGLTLAPSDFSGSITATHDKYELTVKVAPAAAWKPTANVTISSLALTLSNVCPVTGAACPPAASLFLDIKGDASFSFPSIGTVNTSLAGALALPSGEFSVAAKLTSPLSIGGGLLIDTASVTIEHGLARLAEEPSAEDVSAGGLRVDLTGGITVPGIGKLPTVHASFSSKGWAIAAPLGSFSIPGASGDGSKLGSAALGWSSYPTTLKVVDPLTKQVTSIALKGGEFKLTGDFATPSWLAKMLKLPGDVKGRATGTIDPGRDYYALRMEFDVPGQPYLYGGASSATSVKLTKTYFEILRQGATFDVALGGTALMNVMASGSVAASSVDLNLALSYAPASQTIAGSLSFTSPNGWRNAFGVNDLTLYNLSLAFQFSIPTLTPAIGFGASAVLPGTVRSQLGVVNGARTTIVANISLTNPCIGLEVDDPLKSGVDVLSVGGGTLTAKAFRIEIAPTGCTVGAFRYAPGVSLEFDGKVAGVTLAINARLQLTPFAFDGSADLGEFVVGGMTMKKTHIEVRLSANQLRIKFAGGVEVFGTNVDLTGSVDSKNGTTIADFSGTLDKLALGGDVLTAKGIAVKAHIETGPARNVLQFSGSGAITLLGSSASGKFDLSLANGQLNAAKADIVAQVKVSQLTLDGTFKLDYSKTTPFTMDATVRATLSGQSLANAQVSVRPGYLTVATDFSVGSVFSARLEGAAYYGSVPSGTTIKVPNGATVAAKTGDFYISASNVSLTLAGFRGTGAVWVGSAGGTYQAALNGTIQVTGTGTNNTVSVAGSIDSNGNFSLSGRANLDLAGFTPQIAISVAKSGSTVSVSGSGSVSVLGSSLTLAGDFRYDGGQYRFRLNGAGSLNVGGYNVSNATVKLSNFPEDAGFAADINLRAGSVLNASGRVNIDAQGRFGLAVATSLDLRVARMDANINFKNYLDVCTIRTELGPPIRLGPFTFPGYPKLVVECTKGSLAPPSLNASGTLNAGGVSWGVAFGIASDGAFNANLRSPTSGETTLQSGEVNLGVVKGFGRVTYHFNLGVSNRPPYVSVDAAGKAEIVYSYYKVWSFSWSGWDSFGIGVSLKTNPFQACASASVVGKSISFCVP